MPGAAREVADPARVDHGDRDASGGDPRAGRGPKKGAPNAGRTPSAIRAAYRLAADARVPVLLDIHDGKPDPRVVNSACVMAPADPADRMKAWDMLNRYGLGTTATVVDTEHKAVADPATLAATARALLAKAATG